MATILVVDDKPLGRQYLTTLLGYSGHRLIEAADGAEALEQVRATNPELVIADIVMPTMDGYEFVRQLRSEPAIASTPVIFYTATYHQKEARALAQKCGVLEVLPKPSEPKVILETVASFLNAHVTPPLPPPREEFDREHARLLADKLAKKLNELEAANMRLASLLEIGRRMALELDPTNLLGDLCSAAREITAARFAVVGLIQEGERALRPVFVRGADTETLLRIAAPVVDQGVLVRLLLERQPISLPNLGDDPLAAGFSPAYLSARSFLGVTVSSPSRTYGVLCLIEKLGAEEFSREDERVIATLGAQAGVAYENLRRFDEDSTPRRCPQARGARAEARGRGSPEAQRGFGTARGFAHGGAGHPQQRPGSLHSFGRS